MTMEWEYSRTRRKHYINDGEVYATGQHWNLWEICSSAPYGFIQEKHGYDLCHKGKFIQHGKTVKELKIVVESGGKEDECSRNIFIRTSHDIELKPRSARALAKRLRAMADWVETEAQDEQESK